MKKFTTAKWVIMILFFCANNLMSQDSIDYSKQKDLKDIIKNIFGKKKRLSDSIKVIPSNDDSKWSLSILPGVSYNPATDVIIGVNVSATKYFGNRSSTTNSTISSGVSYSTKKQFKLSVQSSIFTNNNGWSLQGDFRLWNFSQLTYGLGTGTIPANKENMEFKLIRINQNVLKKIANRIYAGIGYSLETYYSITTIDDDDKFIYPNYNNIFSKLHGFDSTNYLSSGLVLNLNYDSRDNTVNAYKGIMADLKYYYYEKFLGSFDNYQRFDYELRAFQSLNKNNTYRIAFWLLGNQIIKGNSPYMSLPASGWDKTNSMARGYVQGRFRGRALIYAEIENRINLTSNGLLGLVLFGNAITVNNPDASVRLFDYIEPGGGVGLRIKFDKYSRTNIAVDYGFGNYGSKGVFLTIGEFF